MRTGCQRISKKEWSALGGLTNPNLFTRTTRKGLKTYYKITSP
jgi:hypothetical protein